MNKISHFKPSSAYYLSCFFGLHYPAADIIHSEVWDFRVALNK